MASAKSFDKTTLKVPEKKIHSVKIENCSDMSLNGVIEVTNFSDNIIELVTLNGGLIIKGKNLNMSKLNTDTGELDVNGEIQSIQYSPIKKKGSIFEGLFK